MNYVVRGRRSGARLAQSPQAVGFGGEIAPIGVLSMQGDTNPMPLMVKGASLRGIFVGSAAMARELNGFVDWHAMAGGGSARLRRGQPPMPISPHRICSARSSSQIRTERGKSAQARSPSRAAVP